MFNDVLLVIFSFTMFHMSRYVSHYVGYYDGHYIVLYAHFFTYELASSVV